MRLSLPATPSFRDQQIYRQYSTCGKDQEQLAQEHHITQQRVSQIIAAVQLWLGAVVPQPNDLTPEERLYVACRDARVKCEANERWTRQLVEKSVAPQVIITQQMKDKVVHTTEKRIKYGKCDHHVLQKYLDLGSKVVTAIAAEVQAEGVVRRQHSRRTPQLEDLEVLRRIECCRELRARVKRLRQAGLTFPPLPRFNRKRIEAFVRLQFRRNFDHYTAEDLTPPEWLEVQHRLFPATETFAPWLEENGESEQESETGREVESGELGSEQGSEEQVREERGVEARPEMSAEGEESAVEGLKKYPLHKSVGGQKDRPCRKSERDESDGIPEDDESYAYAGIAFMDGRVRTLRTCKRTGRHEWVLPPAPGVLEAQREPGVGEKTQTVIRLC